MALTTWWHSDPLPTLPFLPGFTARRTTDIGLISELNRIDRADVCARLGDGHHAYIAALAGQPVGYGWAATRRASIGELNLNFTLAHNECYLWDCATLPGFRGQGIYPRLLQMILAAEASTRTWILHAPENLPSGAGMARAGFQAVGQLSFRADGSTALLAKRANLRARWGAMLLGIELTDRPLSPCWCCPRGERACGCRVAQSDAAQLCSCAIAVGSMHRHAA